jgi:hypothetical protein
MKQFKAEWQSWLDPEMNARMTTDHLITQHNALCDYLEERLGDRGMNSQEWNDDCVIAKKTITIPKPEWWGLKILPDAENGYLEALTACGNAIGVTFILEE